MQEPSRFEQRETLARQKPPEIPVEAHEVFVLPSHGGGKPGIPVATLSSTDRLFCGGVDGDVPGCTI
jgi:hypothetical protein